MTDRQAMDLLKSNGFTVKNGDIVLPKRVHTYDELQALVQLVTNNSLGRLITN